MSQQHPSPFNGGIAVPRRADGALPIWLRARAEAKEEEEPEAEDEQPGVPLRNAMRGSKRNFIEENKRRQAERSKKRGEEQKSKTGGAAVF